MYQGTEKAEPGLLRKMEEKRNALIRAKNPTAVNKFTAILMDVNSTAEFNAELKKFIAGDYDETEIHSSV